MTYNVSSGTLNLTHSLTTIDGMVIWERANSLTTNGDGECSYNSSLSCTQLAWSAGWQSDFYKGGGGRFDSTSLGKWPTVNPARESGEHCKLPEWGQAQSPIIWLSYEKRCLFIWTPCTACIFILYLFSIILFILYYYTTWLQHPKIAGNKTDKNKRQIHTLLMFQLVSRRTAAKHHRCHWNCCCWCLGRCHGVMMMMKLCQVLMLSHSAQYREQCSFMYWQLDPWTEPDFSTFSTFGQTGAQHSQQRPLHYRHDMASVHLAIARLT